MKPSGNPTAPTLWTIGAVLLAGALLALPGLAQFSGPTATLTGVDFSSVAWGDYDGDGDLDVLLTGAIGPGAAFADIYRNDTGTFIPIGAPLVAVSEGSVAWGDFDNDGDLDALITGFDQNTSTTVLYQNDNFGAGFSVVTTGLPGVLKSSAAWGDCDNDGDLDVVLTGWSNQLMRGVFEVYRNNGSLGGGTWSFNPVGIGHPGVRESSVAWGDYDNDSDLDLLLLGIDDYGFPLTEVYENDGCVFNPIPVLPAGLALTVERGALAWGDYDADGDLDILLTGHEYLTPNQIAKVYRNDGQAGPGWTFTDIPTGLTGVSDSAVAWGDHNSDGYLDILLTGFYQLSGNPFAISEVYDNNGGTFVPIGADMNPLRSVTGGSVAWGDYDEDGDLDVLLTGNWNGIPISHVYDNQGGPMNMVPDPPDELCSTVSGSTVTLSWDHGSDPETPQPGLTYNFLMGTQPIVAPPQDIDVSTPMASTTFGYSYAGSPDGYRYVAQSGNTNHNVSWPIHGLVAGQEYYWCVQAIDNSFTGSSFACGCAQRFQVDGYPDGARDDFDLGLNNPEKPSPSTGLQTWIAGVTNPQIPQYRDYDECTSDKWYAHTFANLAVPGLEICGAELEIRLRGCNSMVSTDWISLSFVDALGQRAPAPDLWGRGLPDFGLANGVTKTLVLDLENLPIKSGGNRSLICAMNDYGFLDLTVQDDTAVDYVELTVSYCCSAACPPCS